VAKVVAWSSRPCLHGHDARATPLRDRPPGQANRCGRCHEPQHDPPFLDCSLQFPQTLHSIIWFSVGKYYAKKTGERFSCSDPLGISIDRNRGSECRSIFGAYRQGGPAPPGPARPDHRRPRQGVPRAGQHQRRHARLLRRKGTQGPRGRQRNDHLRAGGTYSPTSTSRTRANASAARSPTSRRSPRTSWARIRSPIWPSSSFISPS